MGLNSPRALATNRVSNCPMPIVTKTSKLLTVILGHPVHSVQNHRSVSVRYEAATLTQPDMEPKYISIRYLHGSTRLF